MTPNQIPFFSPLHYSIKQCTNTMSTYTRKINMDNISNIYNEQVCIVRLDTLHYPSALFKDTKDIIQHQRG